MSLITAEERGVAIAIGCAQDGRVTDLEYGLTMIHGDCLRLMPWLPPASVDLILCDLPYGTSRCAWDEVIPFDLLWAQYTRLLKPGGAIALTGSQPFTSKLILSNTDWFKYELIWLKNQGKEPQLANARPQKAHENVCVFAAPNGLYDMTYNPQKWRGLPYSKKAATTPQSLTHAPGFYGLAKDGEDERYPLSYLYFPAVPQPIHPTQKPLELMEYLVKTYSAPGGIVLDNCMGSGTTGVACLTTGRRFIGMELNPVPGIADAPEYFMQAVDRIAREVAIKIGLEEHNGLRLI